MKIILHLKLHEKFFNYIKNQHTFYNKLDKNKKYEILN